MVQWLELPVQGSRVQSLFGELRSHRLQGEAKKEINKPHDLGVSVLCPLAFLVYFLFLSFFFFKRGGWEWVGRVLWDFSSPTSY